MTKSIKKLNELAKKDLNEYAEQVMQMKLNNGVKRFIEKFNDDIYFKYNSFNICTGGQGTSKTGFVVKELIKLDQVKNDYHLFVYVTDRSSDVTVDSLCDFIQLPMIKTNYQEVEEELKELFDLKETYNDMIDGKIEKDDDILDSLFVKNFSKNRLHTLILLDDAAFIFDKKSKSNFKKWLTMCRHLNITVFCCIQEFCGTIDRILKTLLTSVILSPGISKDRLRFIHNQTTCGLSFEDFYETYNKVKGPHSKLIIDNLDQTATVLKLK